MLDPIMMDAWHYMLMFIQTHRTCNTKSNPKANYRFQWLSCVNIGSSLVTTVPIWWVMSVNRGSYSCVLEQGVWGKPLPPSQLCCKSKNDPKKEKSHTQWRGSCFGWDKTARNLALQTWAWSCVSYPRGPCLTTGPVSWSRSEHPLTVNPGAIWTKNSWKKWTSS